MCKRFKYAENYSLIEGSQNSLLEDLNEILKKKNKKLQKDYTHVKI